MRQLDNSYTRCRDDACPLHENCLRWLQRETTGWVRLSMQLREPGASNCLYHIRPDDDADD
jgi:hypothetical protein